MAGGAIKYVIVHLWLYGSKLIESPKKVDLGCLKSYAIGLQVIITLYFH